MSNPNVAYSQAKQDQTVYDLFTKKNGFFIEIGAFDGMTLSNTLWLERQHNWTGSTLSIALPKVPPFINVVIDSVDIQAQRRQALRLRLSMASQRSGLASMSNPVGLRNFFKDIGDYVEHSQLSNRADTSDGMALDVVFVYTKTWC
jgi:hypothetical protein